MECFSRTGLDIDKDQKIPSVQDHFDVVVGKNSQDPPVNQFFEHITAKNIGHWFVITVGTFSRTHCSSNSARCRTNPRILRHKTSEKS